MTPQERQLIDDLFARLAKLETAPHDPEAMSAIMQGLRTAPNAVYALVQTALVQDEALKRADSHIQELEAALSSQQNQSGQGQSGGFLDSMREVIFGEGQSHGSVANLRAPDTAAARRIAARRRSSRNRCGHMGRTLPGQPHGGQQYGGQPYGAPQAPFGGGAFLGIFQGSRRRGRWIAAQQFPGMMGGGSHQAFADSSGLGDRGSSRPWSDQSGSDLAKDAGVNDIGSSSGRGDDNSTSRAGLFDQASNDDDLDHDSDGFDDDGGGDSDDA
jgi:hypothetical protein